MFKNLRYKKVDTFFKFSMGKIDGANFFESPRRDQQSLRNFALTLSSNATVEI